MNKIDMINTLKKWGRTWPFWLVIYLVLSNFVAVILTTKWDADHWIGLLLGNLVLVAAFLFLLAFYRLTKKLSFSSAELKNQAGLDQEETNEKIARYYRWSFWILGLLMFLVPLLFIIHVPDSAHNWDYFVIFNGTSALQGSSFENLPMGVGALGYFLRYPNNQFFAILFNHAFAGLTDVSVKAVVVTLVSSALTSSALLATSLMVKNLQGKKLALLFNVAAAGFLPFYVYGAQLYTDSMTLPFVCFGLLFFIYAIKSSSVLTKIAWFALASLFLVFGYEFKPTVAIIFIAGLLYLIVNKNWKNLLIALPLFLVIFAGGKEVVKLTVATEPAFSEAANERYNLPMMHWVAMSWDPSNTTGGFKREIREYSESFTTYEAKKKADTDLFLNNMKEMGLPGVLRQIGRKLVYTWLNPDLRSEFYTYRHENPIINRYFDYLPAQKAGNITGWVLLKAAHVPYWIALVVFMWKALFNLLFKAKNWKNLWFIPPLSLFGLFVFLVLWEANSRYLYNFAPLMIAVATLGFAKWSTKGEIK